MYDECIFFFFNQSTGIERASMCYAGCRLGWDDGDEEFEGWASHHVARNGQNTMSGRATMPSFRQQSDPKSDNESELGICVQCVY